METTRLSSKGQVVLPKVARDAVKWPAGTDLIVDYGADYITLRRKERVFPTTALEDVVGCLKYDGPPVSVEDMERAVEEELGDRWKRKSR